MDNITVIKKDALVPLNLGTSFINKLQQAFVYFMNQKTDEEVQAFTDALKGETSLSEWMTHYETLALLIKAIEDSAMQSNLTEEKDVTSMGS